MLLFIKRQKSLSLILENKSRLSYLHVVWSEGSQLRGSNCHYADPVIINSNDGDAGNLWHLCRRASAPSTCSLVDWCVKLHQSKSSTLICQYTLTWAIRRRTSTPLTKFEETKIEELLCVISSWSTKELCFLTTIRSLHLLCRLKPSTYVFHVFIYWRPWR